LPICLNNFPACYSYSRKTDRLLNHTENCISRP